MGRRRLLIETNQNRGLKKPADFSDFSTSLQRERLNSGKIIHASGSLLYTHTFGAYNWRNGWASHQTKDRKNSDSFIEFIEPIMLTECPDVKVFMVMDNASYHRSTASTAPLSLFEDRLSRMVANVLYLPQRH